MPKKSKAITAPVRKLKANHSITPREAREKQITDAMSLREIERFAVLWDKRRGLTHAAICKKYHLSLGAVKHIIYNYRLEDCAPRSEDIERYIMGLNSRLALMQNDVLDSVTEQDIKNTSFAQRMVVVGILADKLKQFDAHLAGSEESKPKRVDWRDKDELIRRIKKLQQESPAFRTLEAEDAVVIEDSEAGEGSEGNSGRTELPGQGSLFPPESVEEHAKKDREADRLARSSNQRLGVSFVTSRPRTESPRTGG